MRRTTVATVPAESGEAGGRLLARAVSKVAVLVPPWLMLGVTAGAGGLSHAVWGQPPHVTWVGIAATLATTGLTGLTWVITHARRMLGRVHATATTAAAGGWLTVVTVAGFGPDVVTGALWWGGGFLALSWNLRTVIRHIDPDQGSTGDALSALFDRAKEQASLKGARARTKEVSGRKVKGALALEPGKSTVDDVQRAIPKLESGMQVPPGTIAVAADPDRADLAEITLSDPRVLRKPIPWAGPSRPGSSIADPIRVGVWQDGDDSEFLLPGRHLQVMGMIGSGKSIGGCWNILGESMTRKDVAIFGIDTSKDDQTFGPLRPGLARLDTNKTDATRLLRAMHAKIPERTKWLAQQGFSKWEAGCGLDYWVLWIEEAAKFMASLSSKDEERLEEIVKEIRSAGGSIVLSLQRSDYTQMSTLVRGQLAKMCFGLGSAEDARWGLSTRQQKIDTVEPEAWENNYPGMYHLDAAGVTEKHAYMPGRSFDWGATGRAVMADHAATYAQANRQPDPFTADLINLPTSTATTASRPATSHNTDQDDDDTDDQYGRYGDTDDLDDDVDAADDRDGDEDDDLGVADDVLTEAAAMDRDLADPDPVLTASSRPNSPIQQPTADENDALTSDNPPQKLSPADARAALLAWLDDRAATSDLSFKASDDGLAALRHQIGMSRAWTYKVLRELVDNDRLALDNGTYTITTHDGRGGNHDGGWVAA